MSGHGPAMTWAYVYFMKDEAARVREVAPRHARYWSETGSAERGGPFGDRSGGLIILTLRTRVQPARWSPTTRSGAPSRWSNGG
jgi:hypothetical protein